jgi:hypothetical protein
MQVYFDYSVEEKAYKVIVNRNFKIGVDNVGEKVFTGSTIIRI